MKEEFIQKNKHKLIDYLKSNHILTLYPQYYLFLCGIPKRYPNEGLDSSAMDYMSDYIFFGNERVYGKFYYKDIIDYTYYLEKQHTFFKEWMPIELKRRIDIVREYVDRLRGKESESEIYQRSINSSIYDIEEYIKDRKEMLNSLYIPVSYKDKCKIKNIHLLSDCGMIYSTCKRRVDNKFLKYCRYCGNIKYLEELTLKHIEKYLHLEQIK